MTHGIPKAHDGSLEQGTADGSTLDPIRIGTAAWYSWLDEHRSFRLEAGSMTFTARKEHRPGGWYWYAYRRRHGKLRSAYLGKSEELTLERLNTTAQALEQAAPAGDAGATPPPVVAGVAQSAIVSLATAGTATRAVTEQLWEPKSAPKHNLPVEHSPLIGRKDDSASVAELVRRQEVRLLTLTGPAGVGKTRLALHIATELLDSFAGRVYFVPLAPIKDPALVLPTIAQTLTLNEASDQYLLDLLADYLQDKHILLLLDNFEQVVRAAPLLSELLEVCQDLKLLVTSREVLHLRAEHQFAVPPLALPDLKYPLDSRALKQYPSVELFLQRAQSVKSDFEITPANAVAIGEICSRLDGLPLAIELAAARIKHLSPQALLARLEHRLSVLTGGAQDTPVRQQTLRNTVEWSYNLLDAQEQQLFRRLCVFVGGGTLEAIEAICGMRNNEEPGRTQSSQVSIPNSLDVLASLIDKSLLQQKEQEDSRLRFFMLETIREYGLEALEASGEVEAIRQAHGAYYLRLAEEAELGIRSPMQTAWLEYLEREHDNLRAALRWMLEHREIESSREMALRLASALSEFWRIRGYDTEGQTFLEQALSACEGVARPVRATMLRAAGRMALYQSDYERAGVLCEESLALFRELGDMQGIAHSLHYLGWAAREMGNLTYATPLVEEALALRRRLGHKEDIAWSLLQCGILNCLQGEYTRADALFEESLDLSREICRPHVIGWSLYRLAEARFLSRGNPDSSAIHSLLDAALPLFKAVGEKSGMISSLYLSGRLALSQEDAPLARSLAEQGLAISRESGESWSTGQLLSLLGEVAARQGDHATACTLYKESLDLARRAGRKLAIASNLQGLAGVVALQGEFAWATRLWSAAESLREAIGAPMPPVERAGYDRSLASVRAQLGGRTFAAVWEEGCTMTPEQALAAQRRVTATMQQLNPPPPRPFFQDFHNGLTEREIEVLCLVTLGLSDAQVANHLFLSPRTVQGHLRSIYNKLNVTSRGAATRYAVEHKLV